MKQTTVGDVVNAHRQEIESLRQQLAEKDSEIERLKANSVTRTHLLLDGIIAQAAASYASSSCGRRMSFLKTSLSQ